MFMNNMDIDHLTVDGVIEGFKKDFETFDKEYNSFDSRMKECEQQFRKEAACMDKEYKEECARMDGHANNALRAAMAASEEQNRIFQEQQANNLLFF